MYWQIMYSLQFQEKEQEARRLIWIDRIKEVNVGLLFKISNKNLLILLRMRKNKIKFCIPYGLMTVNRDKKLIMYKM